MTKKSRDRRVAQRRDRIRWIMSKPIIHGKYHYDEHGFETIIIEDEDFREFYEVKQ